ncbi:MAG: 23S rRNA (adenine(2503)-C(2))-methyltransferase RlmN [Propionibacteriaceae bacterium]|nr:23S rRNA (adenine(2503)-C(2))-methyltransferase RlmN [Propionibacteriaceae bacterium]
MSQPIQDQTDAALIEGLTTPSPRQRRAKPPLHWADASEEERATIIAELGLPKFRLGQVNGHYFSRYEADPASWSDLPLTARDALCAWFPTLQDLVTNVSADRGTTIKSLYRMFDGVLVECVVMRYGLRHDLTPGKNGIRSTLCVSSQAGCGIGCPFCATGQAGLTRNLSGGEITEQIRLAAALLEGGNVPGGPGRLNNIVYMGMGEPLANYDAVMGSVRAAVEGFGISARGITVSTSGLVPRIADLAREGLPLTLAVSLHAPDNELRDELVPINRRWPVGQVLDAARAYFEVTGRRVSIEYALMRDINDQAERAIMLGRELNSRGRGWVHVNLIPLNPTPGSKWTASRRADEAEFVRRLELARVPVTIRDTRGSDIDGACGQLAARHSES